MPETTIKTCAITGAHGFVGGQLAWLLRRRGWRVREWTRAGTASDGENFRLGDAIDPARLRGVDALVHCAYDFSLRNWNDIARVNVGGSEKLFAAASAAGVGSIVFISSISAFPGCRSLYGKAKLEAEAAAVSAGARVIRPGLVYGDRPGGVFGRLVEQVKRSRVVPIVAGGAQTQYLIHVDDLGELVLRSFRAELPVAPGPITAAHEKSWELRAILGEIACALGKRLWFVPVPWRLVWGGLKGLELAGLNPKFRSDSLLSMVHQNPQPSFDLLKAIPFQCRPFAVTQSML
jgi:nucleoside-diphosphate-sugar epimerase